MTRPIVPDRWEAIAPLLDAALDRAPESRPAFLDDACGGDTDLRGRVDTLLAECERSDSIFTSAALERFSSLLGDFTERPVDAWRQVLQEDLGPSYRLREELGGGSMSATFIAEETALGRSVVLKVLPPELSFGLNAERFEREIRLAARLQHAFIVPLLAAGVAGGKPWYAMPLVQGESLRARLAREGALTATATARILRDLAEALAYAHAQGVVHRDIKPDNILLSGAHAMVTDFGVAKALSASTAASASATASGIAIGTPAYMAPEQAAGDPDTDHRADLYALGATAYEMLSGRRPFGERAVARLFAAHALEQPEPLSKTASEAPRELTALVEQLLAKHPNDRPARAQDVANTLSAMLARWTSGESHTKERVTLGRAIALWGVAFVGVIAAGWLAVRFLPVPDWTLPAAIVVMLAGLPVLLITAWLHRSDVIPTVPTLTHTTTMGRIEALARPHLTWRRATRGGVIAVGSLAFVAACWGASRALGVGPAATLLAQGRVAATDQVFVADFDSPASDTGLGLVVAELLRTEIGRSESIRMLGPNARATTLASMGRPASARVGPATAREFSQRANAKVYLNGVVRTLGQGFLITAALVATSSGDELATFRETSGSPDDVIAAVDRMGRDVRDRLGASLREVRADPPLLFAVTPSLEAARYYSEGYGLALRGEPRAGLRLLEQAVIADTEFAMAYRAMSAFYNNTGQRERQSWAGERAFRYREKLPPSVRRMAEGTYYFSPIGFDLDKSIEAYEAAVLLSPDNATAWNNLAVCYRDKRDYERSLEAFRKSLQYDSTSSFAPFAIVSAMWVTGRKQEAREHVEKNLTRWRPNDALVELRRADLASADLYVDSAEAITADALIRMTGVTRVQRATLLARLAQARRTQGRLKLAQQNRLDGVRLGGGDTVGRIPQSVLFRANIASWDLGDRVEALRVLDSVRAAHPEGNASAEGYNWIPLAAAYAMAGDASNAKELLGAYEQKASANVKRKAGPPLGVAHGWIAMAEKRYGDAITTFRAAAIGESALGARAALARAYDSSNQPDSAIAAFERYLSTNNLSRESPDFQYLAGTYRRLGELYDARGDTANAAKYYRRFVDLWKNADPELQPKVAESVRRLAKLTARP